MRRRFCATMRRPACSIIALIAPVRLRAVASGLMIEKVRSIAMGLLFRRKGLSSRLTGLGTVGRAEIGQFRRREKARLIAAAAKRGKARYRLMANDAFPSKLSVVC